MAAILVLSGTAAGADEEREIRVQGPVTAYSSVADNPVVGVAARVRAETGGDETKVSMKLKQFAPPVAGRTFGAHVHTGPCADGVSAGPHYTNPEADPSLPLEQREIWLDFTVGGGGNARVEAERDFLIAPGAAKSIVIHANPTAPDGTAGTRLGCLGLEL